MDVPDPNAMIDQTYEFSAPKFFDFINGETEDDVQMAEHWFETALSYAPSPFMPRIKTGRSESIKIESLCDFSNADNQQKQTEGGESGLTDEKTSTAAENSTRLHAEAVTETRKAEEIQYPQQENKTDHSTVAEISKKTSEDKDGVCTQEKERSISTGHVSSLVVKTETGAATRETVVSVLTGTEACCTPIPQMISRKEDLPTNSKKTQTAKRIASLVRNPSALKTRNQSLLSQVKGVSQTCQSQLSQVKGIKPTTQSQFSHAKGVKPASARRATTVKNTITTSEFAQENQAIKRQKLDEGRSRQILNIRFQTLPHKSRPGSSSFSNLPSSTIKTRKEDRKVYVREQATPAPFVSTAELVKRFQSNTRDVGLHFSKSSLSNEDTTQRKPKLTLTRPVEPAFETSQRVRSVRVKSSAELEEEMMAKIPKFKARPLNKKMLETPTLPALPRSIPQLPEFQEFHLKTMERANQHAETSTVVSSTESSHQNQWNPHKLTEPKTPRLETSVRARPSKAKSTEELEQEELEKIPKFKARPLNKKIFESKGELGICCNSKRQVTKPQEFHFATDERIPPTRSVFDMFDKLSLNSEPHHDHQLPRLTQPNPFHLHTEERGAEKERRFVVEVLQKQLEEEKARIPKATPYPYTTDYPVVPPKPEPKQCTKPEPFQLESLTRHEEEQQREREERHRMEKEAAQMRIFKAQPILKEDPLPVPEKERKPLTEVQEFSLHVDHRAVDRAEFDKKIKEKEMMYKRYRDEFESAKQMEDEKALKHMRRTMVPHARPVPNFDHPFHPQKSSKETTKAKSPNLRVIRRKEKRRTTTGVEAPTSAAASHMR